MTSQSVALPEVKTWELRDKTGLVRTFEQSELSIEGEVRLVQLAGITIKRLNEQGFPWDEVALMFTEDGAIDWGRASDILTLVIAEVPEFVAETTAILFGLYPLDDNGIRNKEYDSDKKFLKQSLSFTRWIDVLTAFTEQNDYKRLAKPFSLAVTRAMDAGLSLTRRQPLSDFSSQELTGSSPLDTATPEA